MTTRPYQHIYDASDLLNTANDLGSHFFSPGTMRWFNSRLLGSGYHRVKDEVGGTQTGYFVTSEKFDDASPRTYRVRRYEVTRTIRERDGVPFDTISFETFTEHATREEAITYSGLIAALERAGDRAELTRVVRALRFRVGDTSRLGPMVDGEYLWDNLASVKE